MSIIEIVAVIFGLIAVWFNVKQIIWCWPAGLIQVSLYVIIFYQAKLYSDLILHIIYIVLQLYGWYSWLYGGEKHSALKVSHLSIKNFNLWLVFVAVATLIWGYLMATNTDAALPYPDAFTTVTSLVAQYLMTRKKLQSWVLWIVVDVVAIGVYFYKALYLTTGLYAVFLVMSAIGYSRWAKDLQQSQQPPVLNSGQNPTVNG